MRRIPPSVKEALLDSLDRRILREVQQDCSVTAARLALVCGTTESTIRRRMQRLRFDGVIRGQVALVDSQKIGRGILMIVSLRLEREDGPRADAFIERIAAHPHVMQLYFVTGSNCDYMIMLSLRSMTEYDSFLREHLVSDPIVVMSETNVVIRAIKMSLAMSVDDG